MGAVGTSEDRVALRTLVEAYAFAVDRQDTDGFVALFAVDATLTIHDATGARTGGYAGRDELAALPVKLAKYESTLHLVHNHDIVFGADVDAAALGEVYCTAHHVSGTGADAADRVLAIRYVDRYQRDPDRWRFRAREVRVQWIEERAVRR